MEDYEEALKETVQMGTRKQDSLNPQKYRYSKVFNNLPANNTHKGSLAKLNRTILLSRLIKKK